MAMDVVFITVCGAADAEGCRREYNFLLGSIRHHDSMGRHIVLDNTPQEYRMRFRGLPSSVLWVYEPEYGHGKEVFREMSALVRADQMARVLRPDVIVYTDCDEYWAPESADALWAEGANFLVETPTVHVDIHGNHWTFDREWHRRLWPGKWGGIEFPLHHGEANPERHAIAVPSAPLQIKRVPGYYHQHLRCFIAGGGYYADGTILKNPPPWPEPLRLWKEKGIEPLEAYL